MSTGRREVLCHSGTRWAGRLLGRFAIRLLLGVAYGWPTPASAAALNCERTLDAILARPVWWRTQARALVTELLNSAAG